MITRKQFKKTIAFLKNQDKLACKLSDTLEEMAPGFRCDAMVYSTSNSLIVELLKAGLNLPDNSETLEYWLYDLEYGSKFECGCILDENKQVIDISTEDKLYDYLCSIAC